MVNESLFSQNKLPKIKRDDSFNEGKVFIKSTSIRLRENLMTDDELDPEFYELLEETKDELMRTGHNLVCILLTLKYHILT